MRSTSARAFTLVVAAAVAGCGGDGAAPSAPEDPDPAPSPPAAAIEVDGRRTPLAPAGGCLRADGRVVCGDVGAVTCPHPSLPRVPLPPAAAVRILLGAVPATLRVRPGAGAPAPLVPSASASWHPPAGARGLVVVSAGFGSGTVDYRACLVPQR